MTSQNPEQRPEQETETDLQPRKAQQQPQPPQTAERCYRSPGALAAGFALLALALWLGAEAVLGGSGRTPLVALAGLLCFVPLTVAFTLRPAVFAGEERLRVRNPFRTVTLSWRSVQSLRAGYTSEVVAEGSKYQLWSIPVSLRARKAAIRHNARVQSGHRPSRGMFGVGLSHSVTGEHAEPKEKRASSDSAIDELRVLAETHGDEGTSPAPQLPVTVRWAYEIMAPALAGAAGMAYFFAT